MTRGPIASEHQEQAAFFSYLEIESHHRPELNLIFAVPNAAKRTPRLGQWMKDEGMKPGVPDIVVPIPRAGFHGAFLEMKRKKGGVVSPEQNWWITALRERLYFVTVCYGWDDAKFELEMYLSL